MDIYQLGLTRWKENCALVIQRDGKKITSAILQLIMKERLGEKIEEDLVKNAIHSFIALGFYEEEFEAPFFKTTADYYKEELEEVFQSDNFIPSYLNKVEERLLEEERRAQRYLPQKSHGGVIKTLFISRHCEALAKRLLETGDDEKLRGMYVLLSCIKPDGLGLLKKIFEQHVSTELCKVDDMQFTPDGDTSINMQSLPSLSDIQERHKEIVHTCFKGDYNFAEVLGTEVFGTPTFGTQAFGTQTFGTQALGTQTFGTQAFEAEVFATASFGVKKVKKKKK